MTVLTNHMTRKTYNRENRSDQGEQSKQEDEEEGKNLFWPGVDPKQMVRSVCLHSPRQESAAKSAIMVTEG
jgi:hypothetical protein